MRILLLAVLAIGCSKAKETPAAGSGSAPTTKTVGSGSGPAAAPVAATCDLAGSYRMRFRSNGADGWWLRVKIAGDKAELVTPDVMNVLSPPLALAADGCKATITSKNDHSGDAKLVFTLDAKTNVVTGELSRTKGGEKQEADTVPVAGRRDVGPIAAPACIKPGVYEIAIGQAKWKLSEGKPSMGGCKDFSDSAKANIRVEPLGDELFVDEVQGDNHEQSFARAKLTRKTECEFDLEYAVQDWSFKGTVKFDGDKLGGVAKESRYQVFEDGEAGENLWACNTKDAPIEGKRIAD